MDEKKMPKLEVEAFRPVQKPPRLKWHANSEREAQSDSKNSAKETGRLRAMAKNAAQRLRKGSAKRAERDADDTGYRKLLIKTGICAAIAVAILGISSIGSPVTEDITSAVDSAVSHEFDIEEDIGRLKFVQNLTDDVQSVFSPMPETMAVYPAEGEVITEFGEGDSKGVRIEPGDSEIVSIANGTVTAVGDAEGSSYVKIALSEGETAVLYNVTPTVAVDDIVSAGQQIGELSGDYLYMEIIQGEEYIDPIEYIQTRQNLVSE